MADTSLDQVIRDNASGPASVQSDSTSVRQHDLTEQIEADRYLANKAALKRKGLAVKMTRTVPPGAV